MTTQDDATQEQRTQAAAGAAHGQGRELVASLESAAADLDEWVQRRQSLLLLLRLFADDVTTDAEVSTMVHQTRALVEQAQAMAQQLRALREQLEGMPRPPPSSPQPG